jgi:glutamate-1-semialdehyde 2,1-aminomutase
MNKFVAAAREMQADGWWWSAPGLSNGAIRRRILSELVRHRF